LPGSFSTDASLPEVNSLFCVSYEQADFPGLNLLFTVTLQSGKLIEAGQTTEGK
jgi:hypothetical protein